MKHKVSVGDWSKDGHSMSDDFLIEVPDDVDVEKSIKVAEKLLKFKLEDYCEECEDSAFPVLCLEAIVDECHNRRIEIEWAEYSELGNAVKEGGPAAVKDDEWLINENKDDAPEDTWTTNLGADDYFSLWLAILNIGIDEQSEEARSLAYWVREQSAQHTHHIGGYGCYSM